MYIYFMYNISMQTEYDLNQWGYISAEIAIPKN